MKSAALSLLWVNCIERLKDRINNRSFWEAIETTHAITIEGDILIIGLDPDNFNRATHLNQVSHMHAISEVVQELFNQPLKVRVIEGTTAQDWVLTKERDARIATMKQSTTVRKIKEDSELEGWDGLYEYIARLYMQTPHRAMPQGKARYANEALYVLVEAMDTLYPEHPDDMVERSLARCLERIASSADMPATVIAFELERLRAWRKPGVDGQEEGAS